jgi:hypothetical protein
MKEMYSILRAALKDHIKQEGIHQGMQDLMSMAHVILIEERDEMLGEGNTTTKTSCPPFQMPGVSQMHE